MKKDTQTKKAVAKKQAAPKKATQKKTPRKKAAAPKASGAQAPKKDCTPEAPQATVKKAELLSALRVALGFVEKRETMPILSHVQLKSTGGQLTVTTTNLESWFTRSMDCQGVEFEFCAPAKVLYKEVAAIPEAEEDVVLIYTQDGADAEHVVTVNGRCQIYCIGAFDFPAWPKFDTEVAGTVNIDGLEEKLEQVIVATGSKDTRYTLNGVMFDFGEGQLLGTDGSRLHRSAIPKVKEVPGVIIPRHACAQIIKHKAEGPLKVTEKFIAIRLAGGLMLTRPIEGSFPNCKPILEQDLPIAVRFSGKELLGILDGTEPLKDVVKVTINGAMKIEATNNSLGQFSTQIKCTTAGKKRGDVVIGFNAKYLRDAIAAYGSDIVLMDMRDRLSACRINYNAVVMPVRL